MCETPNDMAPNDMGAPLVPESCMLPAGMRGELESAVRDDDSALSEKGDERPKDLERLVDSAGCKSGDRLELQGGKSALRKGSQQYELADAAAASHRHDGMAGVGSARGSNQD